MNKREFFLKACAAQEYRRSAWVISIFALTAGDPNSWKTNPIPYKVVQTNEGHFFVDPENGNQLSKIDDAPAGQPIFEVKEALTLNPGDLPNVVETVQTNYATAIVNATLLIYPFGTKFPFINKRFSPRDVENMILKRRSPDNPKDPSLRSDQYVYVDEYLKYTNAAFSLVAFSQLSVPAHTEKSLIRCPGIFELRDKLIEQNEGRLHDPAVIATIDATLIAYYKDWLKGDDSMGFLITKKSIDIVRKKQFMMLGAELGLDDNASSMVLIKRSLDEGWDINQFPAMNNSLRAGSFNRGQQTELGGVVVKELLRAASNLRITEQDCGSTLGVEITSDNERDLIGFTAITSNYPHSEGIDSPNAVHTLEKITDENVGKYLGKTIRLRSPQFCWLDKTDYCITCVGDRLATSPTGLPTVISAYGSTFLAVFMSAAHSKGLALAKMDYKTVIS